MMLLPKSNQIPWLGVCSLLLVISVLMGSGDGVCVVRSPCLPFSFQNKEDATDLS